MTIPTIPLVKPEGVEVVLTAAANGDEWELVEWGVLPEFDMLVLVFQHVWEKDDLFTRVAHIESPAKRYEVSLTRNEDEGMVVAVEAL